MTESTRQTCAIYTIGHGGRSVENVIDLLKAHGITYLADVRSAPYSRYQPEFSKDALEAELRRREVRYVFMGDTLGGRPEDPQCYVAGKVDYARFQETATFQRGLARLQAAAQDCLALALLCSEGKPEHCHRSKLIGQALADLGIEVLHIDEEDRLCTQEEVILRLTGGQLSLFGPPSFTSRQRYAPEDEPDAA